MTATDEDVTVTVTVKRAELDAVAGRLGTRSDAETVLASVHGAEVFTELVTTALRQLIDTGRLAAAGERDYGVDLVVLDPSGERFAVQIKSRPQADGVSRRRAVPTSEFMAEFEGLRPLDPERFRADIDDGFDTEPDDPYKRARG